VVGYKPSYGRVSRYGVVAFASSLDQVGIFAQDAVGAAALAEVIEGVDERDATSESMGTLSLESLLTQPYDFAGAKVAMLKETLNTRLDADVSAAWGSVQSKLFGLGAHLAEVSVPAWRYALETYYLLCCSEASSNLARYDGVRYGHRAAGITDLDDLYAKSRAEGFGTEVKQRILMGTLALSSGYFDAYFKKAAQVRRVLVNQMNVLFKKYDFVIMPTTPTVAFPLASLSSGTMEMYENDVFTVGVNVAGLPAVSVPAGVRGLPVGIQLIGPRGSDEKLLRAANRLQELIA